MPVLFGAMASDVGKIRTGNEDSVLFSLVPDGEETSNRASFAVVADGMGGHNAGEVASALAVEIVRQIMESGQYDVLTAMKVALYLANRSINELAASDDSLSGMGTTCTLLAFRKEGAAIAHVGDSRAYRWRAGTLTQLTRDQTLVQELVQRQGLSQVEAQASGLSNVLMQALGTRPDVEPEIWIDPAPLMVDDIYVLCSDGLTGMVPDAGIAALIREGSPMSQCDALIAAANAYGGQDNVSVGVFHVMEALSHA